ncbi:MAG: DUF3419 family protein [Alphaproteobacteria bacterium]|nr:DUF3419 family protein [Alphaproteobacteria bacterium]
MPRRLCDGLGTCAIVGCDMTFDESSLAYIITNEDLRSSMELMPQNCKRALTVAASGDHPLFCSLHAALHYGTTITVDTFDITPNARAIMDIKTAAIQCLNRGEYVKLLKKIHRSSNVLNEQYMDKVLKNLSCEEYQFFYSQKGNKPFLRGGWVEEDSLYLPIDSEYKKLQEIIKKPYNFIQTDIANLSAHLTEIYDFMHLSNILDHVDKDEHWDILNTLLKHVNVGGRIVSYSFGKFSQFSKDSNKDLIGSILKDWRHYTKEVVFWDNINNVFIFERVR